MTSCTIIISHYESKNFLFACLRQLIKYAHPEINQSILVVDQSSHNYHYKMCDELLSEFGSRTNIEIIHVQPLYSGYGIDFVLRNLDIKTEYISQYHSDAFPISDKHLFLPIKLIEENNLAFVGQLQFISDGTQRIYPPTPMFAMAQCYNVARTETYKEMSLEAGFTRFHNRPQSGLEFKNDDWATWASDDYANKGSDDDVVAFSWEANYKQTDKLGLAISGYIQASFGRIIDDLVFHFGSANEARGVMNLMPELYQYYTKKINEDYSDELISEMVELAKKNKPSNDLILLRNFWDDKEKKPSPPSDELNQRIEELKKEI